jgi:myo-inositol-1(or 4)-monophosphatase
VPLQVSSVATFADATLVTSLMPGDHNRPFQTRFLAELAAGSAGSRSLWSPALDLAWVACARVDAFVEYGLADWDVDAGELLVREAGGVSASWVWEGYNGTMSANSVGVLGEIAVRIERA